MSQQFEVKVIGNIIICSCLCHTDSFNNLLSCPLKGGKHCFFCAEIHTQETIDKYSELLEKGIVK